MSNFEIKTHRSGRTYNTPHFFILNKGLNSGKPMHKPCPNCFVITAATEDQIQTLFYMCLSLKIGRFFGYYLKGSVIPFLTINDCLKVLKKAYSNQVNNMEELQKHIEIINHIQEREENLKQSLEAVKKLKVAFIHSYFRDKRKRL
tara:strand:+ start:109 stop:546 length:438 start_codon:yes stop_codon:yes gene_type:complete